MREVHYFLEMGTHWSKETVTATCEETRFRLDVTKRVMSLDDVDTYYAMMKNCAIRQSNLAADRWEAGNL